MVAPDIRISIEHDVPVTGPDAEIVLGALMAYNAAHLPPSDSRFVLVIGDAETGAPLAGLSLVQWGDEAYCFWGIWSVPGTDHPAAVEALLTRTEAELVRRGVSHLVMIARAHDDPAPYLAQGFGVRQVVRGHVHGGDYTIMEKHLLDAPQATSPTGLSISLHEPPPKALAREIWRITDERRQALLGAPVKLVAAYVRDRVTNAPRGAALCYAVKDDFMVDMVWLDDRLRGTGTGFAMLAAALDEGRRLGCTRAAVETMDCQAPTFYPQHGFQRFAYVEHAVRGMNMNFYEMKL